MGKKRLQYCKLISAVGYDKTVQQLCWSGLIGDVAICPILIAAAQQER
jgi:hypothetical protein